MTDEFQKKMEKLDRKVAFFDNLNFELISKIAKLDAMLQESRELIISTKQSNDKVITSIISLQDEMKKLNNQFDELTGEDEELIEDEDDDEFGLFTRSEWKNRED